jgi:hypothetical protein
MEDTGQPILPRQTRRDHLAISVKVYRGWRANAQSRAQQRRGSGDGLRGAGGAHALGWPDQTADDTHPWATVEQRRCSFA